ncbi:MAG: AraC family transcriptional regulator [Bacteroidales bacterium]|jgi:YesN/AraC family two-component response regulator|nr:AraC family transcriptional regulator [Bacteroidales bacterium]
MRKQLSIVSLDGLLDPQSGTVRNYVFTNSSSPSDISLEHPFLLKGILFGICSKGTSRVKIDYKEYFLKPNTIFTILPDQIVEPMESSEDDFVENLFFSIDFITSLPTDFDVFDRIRNCPCLVISDEDMKYLMKFHAFILESYGRKDNIYKEEVVKGLIYSLIVQIGSLYSESKTGNIIKYTTRGEIIVEKFIRLLREHHKKERSASFYSDKLCITTKYLSKTLKNITGRSINSWIIDAVILEAKVLLKTSDLTVVQISEELNFINPSFFGRFFKQYAGMTPLDYRES